MASQQEIEEFHKKCTQIPWRDLESGDERKHAAACAFVAKLRTDAAIDSDLGDVLRLFDVTPLA